jgi:hypothetical protein
MKFSFHVLAIFGIILFVSGCSTPQLVWNKSGSTIEDFRRDRYECTQQSRVSWSGGGTGDLGLFMMLSSKSNAEKQSRELFNMCMEARGYTSHEKQEGEEVRK